jgi:hypothetical protein
MIHSPELIVHSLPFPYTNNQIGVEMNALYSILVDGVVHFVQSKASVRLPRFARVDVDCLLP